MNDLRELRDTIRGARQAKHRPGLTDPVTLALVELARMVAARLAAQERLDALAFNGHESRSVTREYENSDDQLRYVVDAPSAARRRGAIQADLPSVILHESWWRRISRWRPW